VTAVGEGAVDLNSYIRDVPDFPSPGVVFKDITPLLGDPAALRRAVDALAELVDGMRAGKVAGIESRGFVLGAPVADRLGLGFIPVRKAGKLPWRTTRVSYDLEYGTDHLEVHVDAAQAGERVAVIDDVLATGGTAVAAAELVAATGATVAGVAVLVELAFLGGRSRLGGHDVRSVLSYD
jgi:adenine phosphoribosyltransferase